MEENEAVAGWQPGSSAVRVRLQLPGVTLAPHCRDGSTSPKSHPGPRSEDLLDLCSFRFS